MAFEWDATKEQAAALLANGELGQAQIAEQLGITDRTLRRWRAEPEFVVRVDELVHAVREAVKERTIADRQSRVAALDDRWRRMQQLIEDRARQHADIPGGETGLLVARPSLVKTYGVAEDAEDDPESEGLTPLKRSVLVFEYAVDTGLLKELREHEKQAAQELGQWAEKREHSGEILVRQYVGIDPDAV